MKQALVEPGERFDAVGGAGMEFGPMPPIRSSGIPHITPYRGVWLLYPSRRSTNAVFYCRDLAPVFEVAAQRYAEQMALREGADDKD